MIQMPDNEFTEQCTGDMPSMDVVWHEWLQSKWDKERFWWLEREKEWDNANL